MKVAKKMTSKSGITIPKQLRHEIGFVPGMAVDLEATAGGVLVKKHLPTCRFCGAVEHIIPVMGLELCADCAKKLVKEVADYGVG